MKHLGKLIFGLLNDFGIKEQVLGCQALSFWPEVVGKKIAIITEAERYSDGKIIVRVSNDAWRNELLFYKHDIVKDLNRRIGSETVKDIMFI